MHFLFAFLVNKFIHSFIIFNTIKNKLERNTHIITMLLLFSRKTSVVVDCNVYMTCVLNLCFVRSAQINMSGTQKISWR